jgi:fatty acid desaturase
MKAPGRVEWPTVALLVACYGLWGSAIFILPAISLWMAVAVAAWAIAQHSSLCHEAIHGHPTGSPSVNAALVFPALALVIPFGRFRDSHLAHHRDANLTDPYDDPESNYLARRDWEALPAAMRLLLRANNTLAGRLVLGPGIGVATWVADDLRAMREGDRAVIAAWLWHIPAVALVIALVRVSPMPLWAYAAAVYLALSLLKIRTFLEHQAHERARGRTAIVEDRGPLALLFLNNNLHVVHHMHPRVPWYRLPQLYRANPQRYLGVNGGYRYRSYGEIFRRYLWTPKDPVAHPILRRD